MRSKLFISCFLVAVLGLTNPATSFARGFHHGGSGGSGGFSGGDAMAAAGLGLGILSMAIAASQAAAPRPIYHRPHVRPLIRYVPAAVASPPNMPAAPVQQSTPFERTPPIRITLGKHTIEEVPRMDGNQPRLLLDGRQIDEAQSFTFKASRTLNGIPVAVIWADMSGASCNDGSSIIIADTPAAVPLVSRVHGAGCWTDPHYTISTDLQGKETLEIRQPPGIAFPGDVWSFSTNEGAHKEADLTFTADPDTGFADLRHLQAAGADIQLFRNEAFSRAFDEVVGAAKPAVLLAASDPDNTATIDGRFLVGAGFQPHNGQHQALIVTDLVEEHVFVADYSGEGKIQVFPVVSKWPSPARKRLASWARDVAPASVN